MFKLLMEKVWVEEKNVSVGVIHGKGVEEKLQKSVEDIQIETEGKERRKGRRGVNGIILSLSCS